MSIFEECRDELGKKHFSIMVLDENTSYREIIDSVLSHDLGGKVDKDYFFVSKSKEGELFFEHLSKLKMVPSIVCVSAVGEEILKENFLKKVREVHEGVYIIAINWTQSPEVMELAKGLGIQQVVHGGITQDIIKQAMARLIVGDMSLHIEASKVPALGVPAERNGVDHSVDVSRQEMSAQDATLSVEGGATGGGVDMKTHIESAPEVSGQEDMMSKKENRRASGKEMEKVNIISAAGPEGIMEHELGEKPDVLKAKSTKQVMFDKSEREASAVDRNKLKSKMSWSD